MNRAAKIVFLCAACAAAVGGVVHMTILPPSQCCLIKNVNKFWQVKARMTPCVIMRLRKKYICREFRVIQHYNTILHQQCHSARHLVSDLNGNNFAKEFIAPDGGISRSSFSETVNNRGLEQLQHFFDELSKQARATLPPDFQAIDELVAIGGSLIDTVLSMHQADYIVFQLSEAARLKGCFLYKLLNLLI